MTTTELIKAFQSELHQRDGAPVADTEDVLHFLNKAQQEFVQDRFAGSGTSVLGFEQSQDVIDDLRQILTKDTKQQAVYGGANAQLDDYEVDFAFLPSDYLHLISTRAVVWVSDTITKLGDRQALTTTTSSVTIDGTSYDKRGTNDSYVEKTVPVRITQSQSVYKELGDPFHAPNPGSPIADINEDRVNVYAAPSFLTRDLLINYIRQPQEITRGGSPQTSELPESLHRDLVERAVRLYLQFAPQPSN